MVGDGMSIPIHNFTGNEPDENDCFTEPLSDHYSICITENWRCKYALLADNIGNYCIHPDHRKYQRKASISPTPPS
jgi:hypothetical protein